ncbi:MAG: Ppx/GppA family phosphatase [Alphaproteobacteria bacterium]
MKGSRRVAGEGQRVAVIDIGSNSIRLVVFDKAARVLRQVFNEKVMCGLGRGLDETGRLNPEGVALALENLPRFAAVARAMGAERIESFATAAPREAADGPSFLAQVEALSGLTVRLLSGDEEARLSALGVVSAIPDADGLVGDLGGGSLELVDARAGVLPAGIAVTGELGRQTTLPLGPFRLMREGRPEAMVEAIDRHLDTVPWLDDARGRALYPVGGTWRTFARIHMNHVRYPLHVIHHYALDARQTADLAGILARLGRKSLQRLKGASKRRLETLPYGALVLERLLRRVQPRTVVFSAYGVREGVLFDALPAVERAGDPLLITCADPAQHGGRFTVDGQTIFDWMAPLFEGRAEAVPARLRLAASWLTDTTGLDHPDYRGEHAFFKALRMPVVGIDHPGRAFLGLTLLARYEGGIEAPFAAPAKALLDVERIRAALVTGLALRVAIAVGAGSSDLLARTRLVTGAEGLVLRVPDDPGFGGEVVRRRLQALGDALGLPRTALVTA